MSENILAQKSFTVRRAAKGSYTFLRYSNDGGKTFTASLPYVDEGEVPGQNLLKGSEQPWFNANNVGLGSGKRMEDETGKFTRYTPNKGRYVSLYGYPFEGLMTGGYSLSVDVRPIGKPITVTMWEGQTVPPDVWTQIEWNDVRKDGKWTPFIVDWRTGMDVIVDLRRLKLERGVSSTAWSPHPSEQLFGLTPGAWLGTAVWGKPYPPLTTDAYTWTKVKGEDGKNGKDGTDGKNGIDGKNGKDGEKGKDGKDAANVYLSTQMLLVNTNDSGKVTDTEVKGVQAQVLAYRDGKQLAVQIASYHCSPEVGAKVQGDTISLTAVRTDRNTNMAYGSGYIDIVADVERKNYPLRLFVGTNITKLTASVVSDVSSFRQDFEEYIQMFGRDLEYTHSRIEQTARSITMEVAARSQGVNLLQGTDFLGDLKTNVHPGDGIVEITFGDDPQIAHTGHRYMHVVAKGLTTQRYAGKSWWAKVEKGKKYTASMWMMTPDKTTIDSEIYLECIAFKGGKDPVWLNRHVTPMERNNTWYAHFDTFGIPDGYDTLQVNAIVVRNGDVYFSEIQLEEGDTRSAWSPYVGDTEAELRNSGIYLKDRKIRMRSDNFEVENNKGERTFVIDKNGKINARLIDADKIFSEEFQTKNVGKGYLKFHDGLIEVYNPEGQLDIRFGVRNGVMELEYLNEDGSVARAYGKYGEWKPIQHDESFNTQLFISLADFGNPPTVNAIVNNLDLMRQLFKQNPQRLQARTPAYYYVAKMYDGQLLPGQYAATAKIAEEADGKYFVSRGDVTTAPRLTAIFPSEFYMPTDGSRKPFDYMLYESSYRTKVVFNDKTPVYSRELYIFENGVRSSVNVYSNTADPLML